ncbi:endonuclease/exonuclease/phosphatase family protein [Flavobacterium capsici]|uniref:Endonuclease/exonuclease/phosphatase family protein n=1 Tax=Flavobacterium capsici TaxID=3075618 RepID=A0AA96EZ50_9FLAO|nr:MULTISPECIES: endonuclease/exonuclease/phosphatase family protein [unclassified Flavobacterium]WNM19555.1 endonuclease/exonuclease/phosphatase family protein [Flavobacterium sp. PMR2A8]WNM20944.1 endonuclease/exonuclease/phosphatase family protein [Flavobacterium sp. PMTSA4]
MKNLLFYLGLLISSNNIAFAQNIKIMTYNIRLDIASDNENTWSNRKEYLCSQIKFYNPDIFGIQEALPNQVDYISNFFSDYKYDGIGRDGIGKGESSNIFYRKERFELLQENTFWLSETPDKISKGWDAALNRICTYVQLKDKITKQIFWVFNTHLDHIGELARTNSIQLILSKIKLLNTENYPVFLIGDFNSEPTEERIVYLKTQMNDSYDISEETPFGTLGTFNGFKHNEPVSKKIDYIFLSKKSPFKVKKYAVLSDSKDLKYPSDHLPVYIEISLN